MFEKGSFIVYGSTGICEVADITTMTLDGVAKDKLFYLLQPKSQNGGKIFTPVDNQKTVMRNLISKNEANRLVDEIPGIEELWIDNEKMREQQYRACLKSGECREWIKVIKTLFGRKQKRIAQGKKITSMDEKYLKMAEEYLYGELSIALGVPENEMVDYISNRIQEDGAVAANLS